MAWRESPAPGGRKVTMKAHLFKYNPANWSWERYEGLLTRWRRGERVVENWSVHNFSKQIVVGSQAWLIG
jgi:hypothetical protein